MFVTKTPNGSSKLYIDPFGQQLEDKEKPTISTTIKMVSWATGITISIYALDFLFYAIFNFGSQDLGWYGSFHQGLCKGPRKLIKGTGDVLVSMGERIRNIPYDANGPMFNSASNEPLLEAVELEDEASFPPPYSVSPVNKKSSLRSSRYG